MNKFLLFNSTKVLLSLTSQILLQQETLTECKIKAKYHNINSEERYVEY